MSQSDDLPPRAAKAATLFERLFGEYETPILNYLFRLVGDPPAAEELMQEAFTRAWRARAQLVVVDNPRAWLYRIATNAANDYQRRRRLLAWLPLLDTDTHLADIGFEEGALESERMRRALLTLTPDYRVPLVIYTCQDFSIAEISSTLSISSDAVKQRLVRARNKLVAFACRDGLCLLPNLSGQSNAVVSVARLHPAEIAWSPDGTSLAVIDRDPNRATPVRLVVTSSQGDSILQVLIAPEDVAEAPPWSPDNKSIFVQTYPYDGRRIIAVDLRSRQVVDLSQAHWDAYFALSPDGWTVLLNNGRGDFWTAPVIRRP